VSVIALGRFRRLKIYRLIDVVIVAGLTALAIIQMTNAASLLS
jgi:hypothetical protein